MQEVDMNNFKLICVRLQRIFEFVLECGSVEDLKIYLIQYNNRNMNMIRYF